MELKGIVKKLYYATPNFSAGVIQTPSGDSRFSGKFLVGEGDSLILQGEYTTNKYGKSFTVSSFSYNTALDKTGLIEVIAKSKSIFGMGPAKAAKFVEKLDDIEDIFTLSIDELSKKTGFPTHTCETIQNELQYKRLHTQIISRLKGFDITFNTINKLVEKYGKNTVNVLETNPYQIIGQVPGFSFKKCDEMALKLGIKKEDPNRIQECILFLLYDTQTKGNSYMTSEEVIFEANKILHIDGLNSKQLIIDQIKALIQTQRLEVFKDKLCLPEVLDKEKWLAEYFKNISNNTLFRKDETLYERAPFKTLNQGQRQALENFMKYNVSIVTGGAGVGKSFLTNSILKVCQENGLNVVLCSPTGNAAKRLEKYTGHPAHTIHKLLGYKGEHFKTDSSLLLSTNVFIVDEVSMCGVTLLYTLLLNIPKNAIVVLIGDANQLPSVDYGNVLHDVLNYYPTPKTRLTECLRQSGELKENCNLILEGRISKTSQSYIGDTLKKPWYKIIFQTTEEITSYIDQIYSKSITEKFNLDLLMDVQLLTPTKKGPLGTVELNKRIQKIIQKKLYNNEIQITESIKPKFYVGDKIINKKNNYNKDIMNGSIGIIKAIDSPTCMRIMFDDREVELKDSELENIYLAYSLTVHSYQGDQVKLAIVICHKSHHFQHNRNLIYTACTRAQQSCAIIGDNWGITSSVKQLGSYNRNSLLPLLV